MPAPLGEHRLGGLSADGEAGVAIGLVVVGAVLLFLPFPVLETRPPRLALVGLEETLEIDRLEFAVIITVVSVFPRHEGAFLHGAATALRPVNRDSNLFMESLPTGDLLGDRHPHIFDSGLRSHSEITVAFMGKSNSSIRHEIPRD